MSTATIVKATANEPAASLKPKEHGAYAILGVPIVTALLMTGPTVPGVSIAISAVAGFFAHEPLLVAWGHRGSRAKRTTPGAMKRLAVWLLITVACGSLAWILSETPARVALAACVAMAASSFLLGVVGRHRTLGGQLWGVVGLSLPCVPILLAGGQPNSLALEVWLNWLIAFTATTIAVRGVIASQKRQARTIHWTAITMSSVLMVVLILYGRTLAIAIVPMILMSWYLMMDPPAAKHLKRVGWTLVAGTLATATWMLWLAGP